MIAARVRETLGVEVREVEHLGGGSIADAHVVELADGRRLFVKTHDTPPPDFFAAEARGLSLLAEARTVAVPRPLAVTADILVLPYLAEQAPTTTAAEGFGRELARLHRHGVSCYGRADGRGGYIGALPLPNRPAPDWPSFYAEERVLPFAHRAHERGALDRRGLAFVTHVMDRLGDVAGPAEPVALVHGDLWSGNLVWSVDGRVHLVDAAAAGGGHRETDLAMLALFGAPFLDVIVAAYDEVFPLAEGWRDRVALHQLHPLLVHAAHFGGHYGAMAVDAAARYA